MKRDLRVRAEQISRVLAAMAALVVFDARAQSSPGETVYRCGPDGRSYSTTPCTGGKAIDVADPRSEEQHRQARDSAQRERELASKMAAERVQREKSIVPAAAGSLGPQAKPATPAPKSAKAGTRPKKKKKAKSTDPTMSDPVRTVTPKK